MPLSDTAAVLVGRAVCEPHAVWESVDTSDGVAGLVEEGVALAVLQTVPEADDVGHSEARGDAVPHAETLGEEECCPLLEAGAVAVAVNDAALLPELLAETSSESDAAPDAVAAAEAEARGEEDSVPVPDRLAAGNDVGVEVAAALVDARADDDADTDADADVLVSGVSEARGETDADRDGRVDAVVDLLQEGLRDSDGDGDAVADTGGVALPEGVAVSAGVLERVSVPTADVVWDDVFSGDAVLEADEDELGDAVPVGDTCDEPESETELRDEGDAVLEAAVERDVELLTLEERVAAALPEAAAEEELEPVAP